MNSSFVPDAIALALVEQKLQVATATIERIGKRQTMLEVENANLKKQVEEYRNVQLRLMHKLDDARDSNEKLQAQVDLMQTGGR